MTDTTFGDVCELCGIEAKHIVQAVPEFTLRQAQRIRHLGRALQSATPEMEQQLFDFLTKRLAEHQAELELARRRFEERKHARTLARESLGAHRASEGVGIEDGGAGGRALAGSAGAALVLHPDRAE